MPPTRDSDAHRPRRPDAENRTEGRVPISAPLGHNLTSLVANTVRYAQAHGIDLSEITTATNLDGFQLINHESRLSDELLAQIWNLIADRAGDGPLPIHMARATPLSIFGPWVYPLRYAPDLRTALHSMVRFRAILANRIEMHWHEDGEDAEMSVTHPSDSLDRGLMSELGVAMAFRVIAEDLDCGNAVKRVDTVRGHGGSPDAYRDFFGVEVRHEQPTTRVVFHASALDQATRDGDPTLFEYARSHLLDLEKRWNLKAPDDALAQVRYAVHACVDEGLTSVDDVARFLHMGQRSLQRLVRSQGETLRNLIDEARAARARGLLLDNAYDTSEIARRLGYSDDRAFRRAFRRWTGVSPQEYRSS